MAEPCTGPKCGRPVVAHGLCASHDRWARRHPGEPLRPLRGPSGQIGAVALVPVLVRLPPQVVRALADEGPTLAGAARAVLESWAKGDL